LYLDIDLQNVAVQGGGPAAGSTPTPCTEITLMAGLD
jgi:hypothetical protein